METKKAPFGVRTAGIIVGYVIIFWGLLPAFLYGIGWSLETVFPTSWQPGVRAHLIATLSWLLGGGILVYSIGQLWFQGKGYPISHLPPTEFVATGLYRVFRHPIYVGYTLMWLATAITLASVWMTVISTLVLVLGWFAYTTYYEEPVLIERFGESYVMYRIETPRLFPRPYLEMLKDAVVRWQDALTKVFGSEQTGDMISSTLRLRYLGFALAMYVTWVALYTLVGWLTNTFEAAQLQSPVDQWIPFVAHFEYLYMLCYIAPFVPFFVLKSRRQLDTLIVTFVMMNLFAFVVFLLFPVEAMRATFKVDSLATYLVSLEYAADTARNCFPSLHAAIAWFLFLHVKKQSKMWGAIMFIIAVGIGLGALFIKQHYLADILAGKLLATWFVYTFDSLSTQQTTGS